MVAAARCAVECLAATVMRKMDLSAMFGGRLRVTDS